VAAPSRYAYLDQDLPGPEVLAVLGTLPKRWGRMDRLSRLAVVEVGRLPRAGRGGLIGFTRRGSLATDLAYVATLRQGLALASPTLFSYTLANIALAEAASHYGLTGPVFSIFAENPGGEAEAEAEARCWLADDRSLDFMIVGELDVYPAPPPAPGAATALAPNPNQEIISVNFRIVS
jgi:hypothetical protein